MRVLYFDAKIRRPQCLDIPQANHIDDVCEMLFATESVLSVRQFPPPYDMYSLVAPPYDESRPTNLAMRYKKWDLSFPGDAVVVRNDGDFDVPRNFDPFRCEVHPFSLYEIISEPLFLRKPLNHARGSEEKNDDSSRRPSDDEEET